MREYGITFDEGSGLAEGHYLLHRRDGFSFPTVFGSFDAGVCGPIEGTAATRLCMAMGHELSKVERFCMHSAEATVVWSADGKPAEPTTADDAKRETDPAPATTPAPELPPLDDVADETDEDDATESDAPATMPVGDTALVAPKKPKKPKRS